MLVTLRQRDSETYLDIVTGREQRRHLAHQAVAGPGPGGVDEALRQLHAQLGVEREVVVGSQEIQLDVFHLTRGSSLIQGGRGLTIVLKQKRSVIQRICRQKLSNN